MLKSWTCAALLSVLVSAFRPSVAQNPAGSLPIDGCWKITQALGTADVYGLTDKQIQGLLGTRVCYSNQTATAGGQTLRNPEYRKTSYDDVTFFKWFHTSLELLDIKAPVSVFEIVDNNGRPLRFLGDTAIPKSAELLILARDGVFCLACKDAADCAERKKPDGVEEYRKIGFGHLIAPGEDFSTGITQKEAEALAKQDSQFATDGVNSAISAKFAQAKFDAMVALAYDIGNGAFSHSELVSALNSGHAVEKVDFAQFDMSNGKPDSQLEQSRVADWNLFSKGKYK